MKDKQISRQQQKVLLCSLGDDKMICEKCKKKMEKPSETPQEAMRKFTEKLKREMKKEKNATSKQSKR